MRKAQKAQLLEILQTLRTAQMEVKKHIGRRELEMACALLGECQRSAVQIGGLIEKSEGEDCLAVRALEDYCEELYQISQSVSENRFSKKADARMHNALTRVENCVKTEIPVRAEMVFFPYKASMFDSLESVWRAADADPDCDAYVVPIPYYEMNPDGSLGELHYEGGEYPAGVPVIDWRSYDLEKRRPDVAFIHNPYDGQNLLTQVPPAYFSRNLKKYVGKLCYIPYFVVSGTVSPHLTYLPAVLNADFTVVESEEVRRQYLSVWEKLARQGDVSEEHYRITQKRIVALGSPKFDALGASGNPGLPKEWERLIFKADGTRKKVVFYNTSICNMLEDTADIDGKTSDRYLKKLESVLDYFRQRDDVVLLWRPHPLLERTFASARPQLYERYLQIVRKYQDEGYGIYDKSPELHRAMEISDVYYGDGSSVMTLWKKSGKPILHETSYVTSYEQCLWFSTFYYDDTCFWCVACDFKGLFCVEKDTLKVRYVGKFPNEEKKPGLFRATAEIDGKLYFAPYRGKSVGVYDKKRQEFFSIPLKEEGMYINAFTYGKYVFMTGGGSSCALRIDTQTNDVLTLGEWETQMRLYQKGKVFLGGVYGCQIDRELFLPCGEADTMLIFNMDDLSFRVYPFPESGRMYNRSIAVGDQVWLCSTSNPFIGIYDSKSGQMSEFENRFQFMGFTGMVLYQSSLLCFNWARNAILIIDIHTRQMEQIPIEETCELAKVVGDRLYYTSYRSGTVNVLDFRTMEQRTEKLLCPEEMPVTPIVNIRKAWESVDVCCYEACYLNLDVFLDDLQEIEREPADLENCGKRIYRYIKDRMA